MIIRLKDGTELNIENGATNGCVAVITDDLTILDTYVKALTKENLACAEIVNENGETVLVIKDKYLLSFDGNRFIGEEKYVVCFRLADVYTLEEKLAKLEEENAKLNETVNELLGV